MVTGISFSSDDQLLATKSIDDRVRLWRTDRWELVTILAEEAYHGAWLWHNSIAFHPTLPELATLGDKDQIIRIWVVDTVELLQGESSSIHLKVGRAVLAGDTGVGKSGLALVLTGHEFKPTESTHGRSVFSLGRQTSKRPEGGHEIRELLLWDLAGQPAYRLVHQVLETCRTRVSLPHLIGSLC
jgi:WD40 repeat protein